MTIPTTSPFLWHDTSEKTQNDRGAPICHKKKDWESRRRHLNTFFCFYNSYYKMFRSTFLLLAFSALRVNGQTEGAINTLDPNGPCTVCASETETANTDPSFAFFTGSSNFTCGEIISMVSSGSLLQGDDECKDYQLWAFQIGCCASPPFEYCPVCPDGSAFTRSNEIPSGTSTRANPTCAENQYTLFSHNALFTPGVCSDTLLQRGAFYCGCPDVEQQCFLCPDEQPPTNPERGDAWITNSNCEGLEYLFSLYTADECDGYRNNYGFDFAHFCKCPNHEKQDTGYCSMCQGGMANPQFTYTSPDDTFQRTCQQAQDFAESFVRESSCIDRMNEVIAKGCQCNDGTGPVFSTEKPASNAVSLRLTSMVFPVVVLSLVVLGWQV